MSANIPLNETSVAKIVQGLYDQSAKHREGTIKRYVELRQRDNRIDQIILSLSNSDPVPYVREAAQAAVKQLLIVPSGAAAPVASPAPIIPPPPAKSAKNNRMRTLLIGLGALIALCVVCGIVSAFLPKSDTTTAPNVTRSVAQATAPLAAAANVTKTPTPQPTEKPLPTKTFEPAEALVRMSVEKFGDKYISAKLTTVEGLNIANVDYDLGAQWDEGTAILTAQHNFMDFAPKIFDAAHPDTLELRSFAEFKDALGNSNKEVAIKFTLTKELARKINWNGIDRNRLEAALSTQDGNGVYVHPALRKAWNDSQK